MIDRRYRHMGKGLAETGAMVTWIKAFIDRCYGHMGKGLAETGAMDIRVKALHRQAL